MPGRIGYHPNEFNWHLSQWIYSQFDRSNSTGQIQPGMKYCSNWVEIHGFTPNSTGHEILLKLG